MAMGATLLAGCGSEEAADSSNTTAADATDADTAADSEAADASDAADAADAADGDVIKIGFAQVGHESDWRTASTNSAQSIFSAENGYDLQFVDCDQDSAVQLEGSTWLHRAGCGLHHHRPDRIDRLGHGTDRVRRQVFRLSSLTVRLMIRTNIFHG